MTKKRPNFNQTVRALLADIAATMPEFRHVKPARILVVAGEARRASRGTVKPLNFDGGRTRDSLGRRKPVVKYRGRRILYVITLRPLFFRASTAQTRIATVLHELYHVSAAFDGTLDRARRHASMGKDFVRQLRPLVRRYLKQVSPELRAAFAFDGEVRVLQWLERPCAWYEKGDKVRTVFTEEQLYWGITRMVSPRPKVAKAERARLH